MLYFQNDLYYTIQLIALEDKIPRGDLIQQKEYSGTNIINWHIAPAINTNNRITRNSNPHCIARPPPAKCSQREQFFTYRVIAPWNSLPHEIVESTSVNQFKNRLDKHLREEKPLQDEARRLGRIRMTDQACSRTGLSRKYNCDISQVCAITLTTCLGQA